MLGLEQRRGMLSAVADLAHRVVWLLVHSSASGPRSPSGHGGFLGEGTNRGNHSGECFRGLRVPVAPALEAARTGKPETAFAALARIAALSGVPGADRIVEAVHAAYRVHPAAALALLEEVRRVLASDEEAPPAATFLQKGDS